MKKGANPGQKKKYNVYLKMVDHTLLLVLYQDFPPTFLHCFYFSYLTYYTIIVLLMGDCTFITFSGHRLRPVVGALVMHYKTVGNFGDKNHIFIITRKIQTDHVIKKKEI